MVIHFDNLKINDYVDHGWNIDTQHGAVKLIQTVLLTMLFNMCIQLVYNL